MTGAELRSLGVARPQFRRDGPALSRVSVPSGPVGGSRIIAHDEGWQTPVVTERHAFELLRTDPERLGSLTYVAFPWATLIDKTRRRAEGEGALRRALDGLCGGKPADAVYVTVCQHIHLRQHLGLFRRAGIDHIFWSHASGREAVEHEGAALTLHGFPLFPVQMPGREAADGAARTLLYAFVGARAISWYLKPTRNWILDHLAEDPRGLVIGREGWHYNRAVYDFQVRGLVSSPDGLIDEEASDTFREVLCRSIFSLCPSGTGPNSIRLWESIGAGAIPVVLSDGWVPPGPADLWRAAAVFCDETEDAVRALPDRLAALAADPASLAARRAAMRQLWLLYGPEGFVYDIQKLALAHARPPTPSPVRPVATPLLVRLARSMRRQASPGRRPKVFLMGQHANRTPIAYDAYRPFFEERIERVERAEAADVLVLGFSADLRDNISEIEAARAANPRLSVAVLSEEPLWDTVWTRQFTDRTVRLDPKGVRVDLVQLNHFTTEIFDFVRLPYFVTTADDFIARYITLFARNRAVRADALIESWRKAPVRAAFYAARRPADHYGPRFPERDVEGLSRFRTDLAERVVGDGVLRVGFDWPGMGGRRTLADWHLVKLADLDRRTFVASAIENTHVRSYITEKLFDAFAIQAVPLYCASPGHRVRELVDMGSFVNLFGLSPDAAAATVAGFVPDRAFAELYRETQDRLFRLVSSPEVLAAERDRVAAAVVRELSSLVS